MQEKEKWDSILTNDNFYLKWPDEIVVRFLAKHLKLKSDKKILDLGSGSGRHTELFASENFEVYACDHSEKSLEITRKRLRLKNLSADFKEGVSFNLPYETSFFDIVVAWGSIYYNTYSDMIKSIKEIYRVLTKGGVLLVSLIAKGDYREQNGKSNDGKTFVGTDGSFDHSGLTYSVIEREELEKILSDIFDDFNIGYHEMYFDKTPKICHWIVTARKN